jgi:hypothetical protein
MVTFPETLHNSGSPPREPSAANGRTKKPRLEKACEVGGIAGICLSCQGRHRVKHALSCRAALSSAAEMPLWLGDCARNITRERAAMEIPTRRANADDRQTPKRQGREKRSVTGARASSSGIGAPGKRSRHQTIPRNDGYLGCTTASQSRSTPQRKRPVRRETEASFGRDSGWQEWRDCEPSAASTT